MDVVLSGCRLRAMDGYYEKDATHVDRHADSDQLSGD